MPLVKGDDGDTYANPVGRIRNTRRLLLCAALIMSVLLLASSVVTTLLIPPHEFAKATANAPAGAANNRAIAYIAHLYLGEWFGSLYDLSTILILWFAGASALRDC
jgi:amino acid transporter